MLVWEVKVEHIKTGRERELASPKLSPLSNMLTELVNKLPNLENL